MILSSFRPKPRDVSPSTASLNRSVKVIISGGIEAVITAIKMGGESMSDSIPYSGRSLPVTGVTRREERNTPLGVLTEISSRERRLSLTPCFGPLGGPPTTTEGTTAAANNAPQTRVSVRPGRRPRRPQDRRSRRYPVLSTSHARVRENTIHASPSLPPFRV